jgi:hypothetical protein
MSRCTFTRFARAKLNAALISSPMRCHSGGCGTPNRMMQIEYAKFRSQSHGAVIRVYDAVGNVVETHDHAGDFKEP